MAPPKSFLAKKHKILSALSSSDYVDKSPKGSVDEPIRELIDLINSHPGWCTTSSCSGRVAVFVEGPAKSTPGGKGGGRWLFVSHDPIVPDDRHQFGLKGSSPSPTPCLSASPSLAPLLSASLALTPSLPALPPLTPPSPASSSEPMPSLPALPSATPSSPRLINLTFAPLILHVLCASLDDAKPLLAAAINAGFRESGVQSLKALDKPEAGVMLAIRTAGIAYSTMVGAVNEGPEEVIECLVTDEYLKLCVNVINERFKANEARKTRLEAEITGLILREGVTL